MIFFHPVIELDKICHKLGTCHELTEPRSAKLLGRGEERLGFFWIDQRVDRRVRIAYDPAQVISQKLLVARVVSLRVRAFLRCSSSDGSRSAQASRSSVFSTPF